MLILTFFFGIFMLPAILSFVDHGIFKIYGKDSEEGEVEMVVTSKDKEVTRGVEVTNVLGNINQTPKDEMAGMNGDQSTEAQL